MSHRVFVLLVLVVWPVGACRVPGEMIPPEQESRLALELQRLRAASQRASACPAIARLLRSARPRRRHRMEARVARALGRIPTAELPPPCLLLLAETSGRQAEPQIRTVRAQALEQGDVGRFVAANLVLAPRPGARGAELLLQAAAASHLTGNLEEEVRDALARARPTCGQARAWLARRDADLETLFANLGLQAQALVDQARALVARGLCRRSGPQGAPTPAKDGAP